MKKVATQDELRAEVLRSLGDIVPEVDLSALKPDVNLRDQLDIDSIDLLNFAIKLHDVLGVDIPEADYPKVRTLSALLKYLSAKLSTSN